MVKVLNRGIGEGEMEKSLYDAALEGDVTTLKQLLEQDPLVLDKDTFNCKDKNPLHLAAMLGNLNFVKAILRVKNSYSMCLARDRNGRNPLHLAAMYGKVDVLLVLLLEGKQAALEKTDGGLTILHLCIIYNQLEALKMLLNNLKDPEFVNAKNQDGMTILHLSIYYDQYETTKYLLLSTRVDVNMKNANGKTALDLVLEQGVSNQVILGSLRESGALKGKDVRSPIDVRKLKQLEWFEKSREAMMVVASLIATMAFQAMISPPGGVWQDDLTEGPNPHRIGEAVMTQRQPEYYQHLIRANTIAFVSSLSTIILLIRGSGVPSKYFLPLLAFVMWLAIATITITYAISLVAVAPKEARGQLSNTGEIVLIVFVVWCGWLLTMLYEACYQFKKWLKIRRVDPDTSYVFSGLVSHVVSRASMRAPRSSGGVTPNTPSTPV